MNAINKITYPLGEPTVSLQQMSVLIVQRATSALNAVQTFRRHPSYDSVGNLKAQLNALTGAFGLAMQLNGFKELPNTPDGMNPRQRVHDARVALEGLLQERKAARKK